MNIINLCKDIINIEYKKEIYINNLIVCNNLEDIKKFENVMKICYITDKTELGDMPEDFQYIVHCVEKIYDNNLNMIFLNYWQFLNKNTKLNDIIVDTVDKDI